MRRAAATPGALRLTCCRSGQGSVRQLQPLLRCERFEFLKRWRPALARSASEVVVHARYYWRVEAGLWFAIELPHRTASTARLCAPCAMSSIGLAGHYGYIMGVQRVGHRRCQLLLTLCVYRLKPSFAGCRRAPLQLFGLRRFRAFARVGRAPQVVGES